jgi:hypothetical protein
MSQHSPASARSAGSRMPAARSLGGARMEKSFSTLGLDGKLMAVDIKAGSTIETGVPQVLFQTGIHTDSSDRQYCATHDGQRFLLAEPVGRPMDAITLVVKWSVGLKR